MVKKYNEEDGVWRTVGGRRIFIKNGQNLAEAMIKSGKFKNLRSDYKKAKEEMIKENAPQGSKTKDLIEETKVKTFADEIKEKNKNEYTSEELKEKYGTDNTDLINAGKEKEERVNLKLSEKQIEAGNKLNANAEKGVRDDVKAFLSGKENYDGSREDFIRDLSDNWGVDKDKVTKIVDEERTKSPRNFKTDSSNKTIHKLGQLNESDEKKDLDTGKTTYNWQNQIKENNNKMEKDVADIQKQINDYRTRSANAKDGLERYQLLKEADKLQDKYYERFRQNERENAKIKSKYERPEDNYVQTDAYAGYKDKFNETWGKEGQKEKVVSAKMYTNDEFMEHLEDANWHGERKQLLEAKLTNQELAYIKDRTKVSAWSVENLTGKEQVNKLIQEAKSNTKNISNSNDTMNDMLRRKAYQKYMKEHPASKMKFEEFVKNKK